MHLLIKMADVCLCNYTADCLSRSDLKAAFIINIRTHTQHAYIHAYVRRRLSSQTCPTPEDEPVQLIGRSSQHQAVDVSHTQVMLITYELYGCSTLSTLNSALALVSACVFTAANNHKKKKRRLLWQMRPAQHFAHLPAI